MIYWIIFGLSTLGLLLIFWRRYLLTVKSVRFDQQMRKEDAASQNIEDDLHAVPQEEPTDLQRKRQAEQRQRDEKTRRLRASKQAYKQGDIHFTKGDYGLAEKYFLEVLSFDNDHLNANLKLGLLYLHQENLPRAEFFFQKLIDLKESPIYFSNLALTLYQQKRLEEAAKLYERAIEMDSKKAKRFVSLAYVYHEMGELEKALSSFETATRLEPRNVDYLWTLLDYYEKFSREPDMVRILKRILELTPYDEGAKGKLAMLEDITPLATAGDSESKTPQDGERT